MCKSFSSFVPPTPNQSTIDNRSRRNHQLIVKKRLVRGETQEGDICMMIMVSLSLYKYLNLAVCWCVFATAVYDNRVTDWLTDCCWVLKWINIFQFSMNLSNKWQLDVMCGCGCVSDQIRSHHILPPNRIELHLDCHRFALREWEMNVSLANPPIVSLSRLICFKHHLRPPPSLWPISLNRSLKRETMNSIFSISLYFQVHETAIATSKPLAVARSMCTCNSTINTWS